MADTQTTEVTDVNSGAEVLGMPPATSTDDSGAFFEALDKEVNSMVYEEPSQTTSEELVDNNMSESPVDGRAAEEETSHNPDAGNVQQLSNQVCNSTN